MARGNSEEAQSSVPSPPRQMTTSTISASCERDTNAQVGGSAGRESGCEDSR